MKIIHDTDSLTKETRVYPHVAEDAEQEHYILDAHLTIIGNSFFAGHGYGEVVNNYSARTWTRKDWQEYQVAVEKAFEIAESLPKVEEKAQ